MVWGAHAPLRTFVLQSFSARAPKRAREARALPGKSHDERASI
jgi:hypothetical protein